MEKGELRSSCVERFLGRSLMSFNSRFAQRQHMYQEQGMVFEDVPETQLIMGSSCALSTLSTHVAHSPPSQTQTLHPSLDVAPTLNLLSLHLMPRSQLEHSR